MVLDDIDACMGAHTGNRCVQYFDGIATFEEISYRTGMQRRELDRILQLFADDVSGVCIPLRYS